MTSILKFQHVSRSYHTKNMVMIPLKFVYVWHYGVSCCQIKPKCMFDSMI